MRTFLIQALAISALPRWRRRRCPRAASSRSTPTRPARRDFRGRASAVGAERRLRRRLDAATARRRTTFGQALRRRGRAARRRVPGRHVHRWNSLWELPWRCGRGRLRRRLDQRRPLQRRFADVYAGGSTVRGAAGPRVPGQHVHDRWIQLRAERRGRRRRGNFVVVWTGYGADDASERGVFGQRYDASGSPRGGEFLVNTYTTGPPDQPRPSPSTARAASWWSGRARTRTGSCDGIFAQRFAADGARRGGEFRVNTYTTGDQIAAQRWPPTADRQLRRRLGRARAMAIGTAGSSRALRRGRRAASAASSGSTRTPRATNGSPAWMSRRQLAISSSTWMSDDQDGELTADLRASGSTPPGAPRARSSGSTRYTSADQDSVTSVADDGVGNFFVAWTSAGQDGNDLGVFAQRFGGLLPAALAVDAAGGPTPTATACSSRARRWTCALRGATSTARPRLSPERAPTFTGPGAGRSDLHGRRWLGRLRHRRQRRHVELPARRLLRGRRCQPRPRGRRRTGTPTFARTSFPTRRASRSSGCCTSATASPTCRAPAASIASSRRCCTTT